MLAGDVEHGLRWTDRGLAQYLALGVGEAPVLLEVRANLLAMAGRTREAVRTYGAVRAHDLRAGIRWPIFEETTEFLGAVPSAVEVTAGRES